MLTACGIETPLLLCVAFGYPKLQQCLPLAVLKPDNDVVFALLIERCNSAYRLRY